MGSRVIGWGSSLPEKIITNDDLADTMDTSDAWIRERTGIHHRHVGGTTSTLAIEAGHIAIERACIDPSEIDAVILATCTPDQQLPGTSAAVQHALGTSGGAFDLNAACSGFAYAMVVAEGLLNGGLRNILVIGAESLSRIVDWTDRNTAILFGDGAGALVLSAVEGESSLLGWDLGCDGSVTHLLYADHAGYIHMEGREVFRRAVRAVVSSANAAMQRAGVTAADIDHLVPHQANIRIVESAAQKLAIPMDKAVMVLAETGNTSAASIPLAVCAAADAGRFNDGDLILMSGFGAGMTWASAVMRWTV